MPRICKLALVAPVDAKPSKLDLPFGVAGTRNRINVGPRSEAHKPVRVVVVKKQKRWDRLPQLGKNLPNLDPNPVSYLYLVRRIATSKAFANLPVCTGETPGGKRRRYGR